MLRIGLEKGNQYIQIPQEKIQVGEGQPRREFLPEELASLAQSIRSEGILQPLLVRRLAKDSYELIAGERRLRASALAGLSAVPCIVMQQVSDRDAAVFALLENLQRQDLTFFEEAEAIAVLISEYRLTQEEAARRLGKKQSTIANKLRLLRFTQPERERLQAYKLTERHARALLRVENDLRRRELMEEVGKRQLTVAQTERLVEEHLIGCAQKKKVKMPTIIVKDVRIFFNTVAHAVSVMKASGINAQQEQIESEEYIEYVIKIPKQSAVKKRTA